MVLTSSPGVVPTAALKPVPVTRTWVPAGPLVGESAMEPVAAATRKGLWKANTPTRLSSKTNNAAIDKAIRGERFTQHSGAPITGFVRVFMPEPPNHYSAT